MSQLVGQFFVSELSRAKLRPRELSVPVSASPSYFAKTGSTYNSQSMQLIDRFGNAVGLTKTVAARTVPRVIKATWPTATAIQRIKLPYGASGGVLRFTNNDDTVPAGILKVYDFRDTSAGYISVGPGSTMEIPAGQPEIVLDVSTFGAKVQATIYYNIEVYTGAVTFNAQPAVGDLITFGEYARFEFVSGGSPTVGNIPVTIGGNLAATLASLITAFNTTYVAAIEPTESMTPFIWTRLIDATDLVYMKPSTAWIQATGSGILIYSVDQGLINDLNISNTTNCQSLSNI